MALQVDETDDEYLQRVDRFAAETSDEYLSRRSERDRILPANKVWDHGRKPASRRQALIGLSQLGPILYAIQTRDGLIKIGYTEHAAHRMRGIGLDRVLAFTFGTYDDEQALHHQLRGHAVHGREWYEPHSDVLAVINCWREQLGRDPISAP